MEDPHEELARSLKEIDIVYGRSKQRLERDLNKMEYHITQIRDTRERIGIKHIKSLDIVQREINKIMPNDLTGSAIAVSKGDAADAGSDFDLQVIRNDLESDDIFSIAHGNGLLKQSEPALDSGGQGEV